MLVVGEKNVHNFINILYLLFTQFFYKTKGNFSPKYIVRFCVAFNEMFPSVSPNSVIQNVSLTIFILIVPVQKIFLWIQI